MSRIVVQLRLDAVTKVRWQVAAKRVGAKSLSKFIEAAVEEKLAAARAKTSAKTPGSARGPNTGYTELDAPGPAGPVAGSDDDIVGSVSQETAVEEAPRESGRREEAERPGDLGPATIRAVAEPRARPLTAEEIEARRRAFRGGI